MNKMPEVAKLLGVEMGEWFEIKTFSVKFKITNAGLKNEDGITDSRLLQDLLCGERDIVKPPYRPREGERYYYVCDNGDISYYNNDLSVADLSIIAFGNCFRSRTEAEANKDKILAKFEEIKKEMEG